MAKKKNDALREKLIYLKALKAQRDKHDPLTVYTPGPTQRACMLCPKMVRLLRGPNRSGKTAHMIAEFAMAARNLHPTRRYPFPVTYVLFAISREQIRDVLCEKLLRRSELHGPCFNEPMIPEWEIEAVYNTHGAGKPVPREIALKNGNRILFGVSGTEASWEFVQGKGQIAGFGIDEQAGTQKLIDEVMARLLDIQSKSDLMKECGGAWFMWATSETLINDTWERLKELALDPARNQDAAFFDIKPNENIAITEEAKEKVGQFMSAEARAIRIEGTGSASGNVLIYGRQWNDARHMRTVDYVPTPDDNLWVGYDPGVDHPTGIILAAISPDKPRKLRIVQCWKHKRMTLAYDLDVLYEWLRGRVLEAFVCDPVVRRRDKVAGQSLQGAITEGLMRRGIKVNRGIVQTGYNRHEPGIALVRQYLDPPETLSPERESLIEVNLSPESGGQLLRSEMMMYRGREESNFTGEGGVVKKHDDLQDPLRYLVMSRPHWIKRPPNPPLWQPGQGPYQIERDHRVPSDLELHQLERKQKAEAAARKRLQRIPRSRR